MSNIPEMYRSGMSIPEISMELGIPRSTVRNRIISSGVPIRSRADGVRQAAKAGKLGSGWRGKSREFSDEHCLNISISRRKWAKANAVGKSLKPSGYLEYTTGENKGRLVHVVEMEKHIGRRLRGNECVHHIDECKTNNDISNLALMTKSAHARLHRLLDADRGKERERTADGRFS